MILSSTRLTKRQNDKNHSSASLCKRDGMRMTNEPQKNGVKNEKTSSLYPAYV